ncbi:DUF742 domain-containing protein [Actinomadura hibisca]|uniref:DUF742 domain-containing protein n=1 Tax=Actinomadura hibisca TaxID=68565 RepID=UPI0008308DB0|nr:DUF742 domain-containing protein [Actinomadura hibisca]
MLLDQATREHLARLRDRAVGRVDWLSVVCSEVSREEIDAEARTYAEQDRRTGEVVERQRAFGLGPEHLTLLRLCQDGPEAVMYLAAGLSRQERTGVGSGSSVPSEDLAERLGARMVADLTGPPGLPIALVRGLLADLATVGLVSIRQAEPEATLADPRTYQALLEGLEALGEGTDAPVP